MSDGLQDPWKRGSSADKPKAEDNSIGTRKSDHPFDADLKHDEFFIIRSGPGTRIRVKGANNIIVAVAIILKAIHEEPALQLHLAEHDFELIPLDSPRPNGFYLKSADTVPVLLTNTTVSDANQGLRALNRALREAVRTDAQLRQILNNRGITPIVE
jgi:hypothetical protein